MSCVAGMKMGREQGSWDDPVSPASSQSSDFRGKGLVLVINFSVLHFLEGNCLQVTSKPSKRTWMDVGITGIFRLVIWCWQKNLLGWILNLMLQSCNQSLGWSHPDLQKLMGNGEQGGDYSSDPYLQICCTCFWISWCCTLAEMGCRARQPLGLTRLAVSVLLIIGLSEITRSCHWAPLMCARR